MGDRDDGRFHFTDLDDDDEGGEETATQHAPASAGGRFSFTNLDEDAAEVVQNGAPFEGGSNGRIGAPSEASWMDELGKSATSFAHGATLGWLDELADTTQSAGRALGLADEGTPRWGDSVLEARRQYPIAGAVGTAATGLAAGVAAGPELAAQALAGGLVGGLSGAGNGRDATGTTLDAMGGMALGGAGWGAGRLLSSLVGQGAAAGPMRAPGPDVPGALETRLPASAAPPAEPGLALSSVDDVARPASLLPRRGEAPPADIPPSWLSREGSPPSLSDVAPTGRAPYPRSPSAPPLLPPPPADLGPAPRPYDPLAGQGAAMRALPPPPPDLGPAPTPYNPLEEGRSASYAPPELPGDYPAQPGYDPLHDARLGMAPPLAPPDLGPPPPPFPLGPDDGSAISYAPPALPADAPVAPSLPPSPEGVLDVPTGKLIQGAKGRFMRNPWASGLDLSPAPSRMSRADLPRGTAPSGGEGAAYALGDLPPEAAQRGAYLPRELRGVSPGDPGYDLGSLPPGVGQGRAWSRAVQNGADDDARPFYELGSVPDDAPEGAPYLTRAARNAPAPDEGYNLGDAPSMPVGAGAPRALRGLDASEPAQSYSLGDTPLGLPADAPFTPGPAPSPRVGRIGAGPPPEDPTLQSRLTRALLPQRMVDYYDRVAPPLRELLAQKPSIAGLSSEQGSRLGRGAFGAAQGFNEGAQAWIDQLRDGDPYAGSGPLTSRAKAEDTTAYAGEPTLAWSVQSVLSSPDTGLPPEAQQALTEAVVRGDTQALAATDFRLKQKYPAYARRVETELRSLNGDE